jgi:hypothetical protein
VSLAEIVLRVPDGRVFTLSDDSGRFDWEEGNLSCDCNRARYIWRHLGVAVVLERDGFGQPDMPCGDTIELLGYRELVTVP